MAGIKWSDPPGTPQSVRTIELDELAAELWANPGQWAIVETNPYAGAGKVYKSRGLEVATRTRREGSRNVYDVYVRAPE